MYCIVYFLTINQRILFTLVITEVFILFQIYVKVTPVNLTKSRENHMHSIHDDTLSLETFEENSDVWPITEISVSEYYILKGCVLF